jgi:ParB-like chromosome segregation protein Spo0J
MADRNTELVTIPIAAIEPCPIQPRVNVSIDLVAKLAASMKAGRHEPVLDVEPVSGRHGRYQIVCGEQRWRAALQAGLDQVLVRVHRRLGYLERLEKQYEENRLRADLDAVEEAHCFLLDKTIRDIQVAERLLRDALVPFQPLDERRLTRREEFGAHLDVLKRLLVRRKVHVVKTESGPIAGQLSPWCETEKALGISESQRKAKLGILRLDPDLQEQVRSLPAEHAVQIARLPDRNKQAALLKHAAELTHKQVRAAVDCLLRDSTKEVAEVADPFAFEARLAAVADLCRQLARTLRNLRSIVTDDERSAVGEVLANLRSEFDAFEETAA